MFMLKNKQNIYMLTQFSLDFYILNNINENHIMKLQSQKINSNSEYYGSLKTRQKKTTTTGF